jgi:hypothetical protein
MDSASIDRSVCVYVCVRVYVCVKWTCRRWIQRCVVQRSERILLFPLEMMEYHRSFECVIRLRYAKVAYLPSSVIRRSWNMEHLANLLPNLNRMGRPGCILHSWHQDVGEHKGSIEWIILGSDRTFDAKRKNLYHRIMLDLVVTSCGSLLQVLVQSCTQILGV